MSNDKVVFYGTENELELSGLNSDIKGVIRIGTSSAWYGLGTTAERVGVKFMFTSTATSGTAWGQQIRMKAMAAGVGCVGLNVSASSGIAAAGNLTAIQGYAQPGYAQASASSISTALYGCTQNPVGVDILGRSWCLWVDTHCTVTAGAGQYLARFSHNGTATIPGCFTIYIGGRMTNFINFEDVSGFLSTTSGTLTPTHKLHCSITGDATNYYIVLGTVA